MKPGRSRAVAIAVTVLGIIVLLVFAVAFKERALERWHLASLKSGDPKARQTAIDALVSMGSARAIPHLIRLDLWKPSLDQIIRNQGPAGAADLASELSDEDWPFRLQVYTTLSGTGAPLEYPLAILRRALHDRAASARRWAAEALAGRPELARVLAGPLCGLLRAPEEEVRLWAAIALAKIEPRPLEVGEALGGAARDPSPAVRWTAGMALEEAAPDGR